MYYVLFHQPQCLNANLILTLSRSKSNPNPKMLCIPGGAPHAAETLEDSLMFASNDGSFQGMQELRNVCQAANTDSLRGYCQEEYEVSCAGAW